MITTSNQIGKPASRVEGRAKVTGAAKYAGEFNVPNLAHGVVVTASIAKGRIQRINAEEALAVAGVLDVLTHANRGKLAILPVEHHPLACAAGVKTIVAADEVVFRLGADGAGTLPR